jgi:CheY-specific phosphatase CheX
MMKAERLDQVRDVFRDVLETMAFMFAEPAERDELPLNRSDMRAVRMSFNGVEGGGTLLLAVPNEFQLELAANMLGIESDDPAAAAKGDDALKELLNVVCGRILTTLYGDRPVFDLSVPAIFALAEEGWNGLHADAEAVGFLADERPVLLKLMTKGTPA